MSSSIGKGLKKSFKSIAKSPWKAIPIAIGVAAAVFTGGSALGVLPSWGSAMASLTSSLGASPALTGILTQAATQAGYGAFLGTAGAALTGNDLGTGATIGGAAGAVTGGLTGGFQAAGAAPLPGTPTTGATPATTGAPVMSNGVQVGFSPAASVPSALPTPPIGAPTGLGGLDPSTQTLIGGAISGIGQGLVSGQSAKDEAAALAKRDQDQRDWIAANYGNSSPDINAGTSPAQSNPKPVDRFSGGFESGELKYDPIAARLVPVH